MSLMFLPLRLIPAQVQAVVLGTVLDLFFSRDDSLASLLEGLEARVFRIHVRDVNTVFYMGFRAGRPWVHTSFDGDADVRIDATTAGFSRLCFAHEDLDDLVFQQVLKLSGDSEAMLRFKKLMQAADIDWERELRAGFGEYFGGRVAQAAKVLIKAEAKVSSASHETARKCLKQMNIPDQERFEAWLAGVEDASRKISRMKARMTRLEKSVQARPPAGKAKQP
ncbi:MAG: SCP2 sterol-binding domain-containing protein [Mariprofundaceae bacterium]|nr:SCP2 sterol-binding domain-containing protein [Mariprofundaceae bacterium]